MIDVDALRTRYRRIAGFLDERGRRLFAANEALTLGRGGVTAVSVATGIARSTINRGIAELKAGNNQLGERIRRRGGGRKRAVERQLGLLAGLEGLIEGAIRGDPQSPLRWVSRSQRNISTALRQQGFEASQKLVGGLLRELDYSCQANRKTREGTQHPDRNAQFEYINAKVKAALAAGQPAISVDTKKKELVGDFKNGGRELRRKGEPEPVRVHDFEIKGLGKVAPYGVLRHRRQRGLGQCRHRRGHGGIRGREHPSLVAAARQGPLSRCRSSPDHGRLRRQQRRPRSFVETRVATLRQSNRSRPHGRPLPSRHQQMEPYRASLVRVHHPELARQAARQP